MIRVGPPPVCLRPSVASASSPAIVRFRPWSPPWRAHAQLDRAEGKLDTKQDAA